MAALVIAVGAGVAIAVGISGHGSKTAAPPPSTAAHTTTPTTTATTPSTTAPTTTTTAPPPPPPRLRRPRIVWKPIPFPAARLAETAAYSERHYGLDTWRLRHPHVIVEHYTASTTMMSAWSLFAQDVPDSELHELPGTCAHFIVDTDGTIYQLVPLDVICRHTVGLNSTAIGIEHVGTSRRRDPPKPRADARLART